MAQINQITKIRLNDGEEVGIVDWSHRDLWSSIDLMHNFTDSEIYAFTYVDSDPVASSNNITTARTASLRDTNIARAGEMDAVEEALVYGLAVEVYSFDGSASAITDESPANGCLPSQQTLALMHARLVIELEVSQKPFMQTPFGFWPAGFGPFSALGAPGSATVTAVTNGMPAHCARHTVQIPVHIGGTEKYKGILYNPGGSAFPFDLDGGSADTTHDRITVRINMDCLHKRPTG